MLRKFHFVHVLPELSPKKHAVCAIYNVTSVSVCSLSPPTLRRANDTPNVNSYNRSPPILSPVRGCQPAASRGRGRGRGRGRVAVRGRTATAAVRSRSRSRSQSSSDSAVRQPSHTPQSSHPNSASFTVNDTIDVDASVSEESIRSNDTANTQPPAQRWTVYPGASKGGKDILVEANGYSYTCLLYTSPSPRDRTRSRMPSSA